jgi:hypothetical protein
MAGALAATGGFLLAVLWMDLMFDSQARGPVIDESALDSISAYYRRATTDSQPMAKLLAAVMLLLLAALIAEAVFGDSPQWLIALSVPLAGAPIGLALIRTVPNAIRLGRRDQGPAEQTRLARAVLVDHVLCTVGMALFVALWVYRSLN